MSTRRGRLVSALVLLAGPVIVAAPAGAVEEIVRMETTVVDCQDMLQGSLGCKRYTHAYTTINPNETKAGRTFTVYTQAEIDERLTKVKTSMVDPASRRSPRRSPSSAARCPRPTRGARRPRGRRATELGRRPERAVAPQRLARASTAWSSTFTPGAV
jgi:hypothetical protein